MGELENIMLSEIRQVQRDKGHVFSLMWKTKPDTNTSIIRERERERERQRDRETERDREHVSQSGTVRGD
jgi:hypothetical protein